MDRLKIVSFGFALLCFNASFSYASGSKNPADEIPSFPDSSLISNGGTGCSGSQTLKFQQSKNAVTIDFLKFVVENKSSSDVNSTVISTVARKSCAISIPVEIPAGWQLIIDRATINGSAQLLDNDQAKIRFDLFIAGTRGPAIEEQLDASKNGIFSFTLSGAKNSTQDDTLTTACGPISANLRANLSATVTGTGSHLQMDSLGDGKTEGMIGFQWRRCPLM